jgi:hypothetical protein
MRRLLIALLLVVPSAGATTALAFRHTTQRAPWTLIDVSRDGRALRLEYTGGGCAGQAKAHVVETGEDVTVRLDQPVAIPENDHEGCTAELRYFSLNVRLKHPIDGRRVLGHARGSDAVAAALGLFRIEGDRIVWLVPRVVGLAPHDARRLLRLQGYRKLAVRRGGGCARRGRVVAQWPHGHAVRHSDRIGLVVRRACA